MPFATNFQKHLPFFPILAWQTRLTSPAYSVARSVLIDNSKHKNYMPGCLSHSFFALTNIMLCACFPVGSPGTNVEIGMLLILMLFARHKIFEF